MGHEIKQNITKTSDRLEACIYKLAFLCAVIPSEATAEVLADFDSSMGLGVILRSIHSDLSALNTNDLQRSPEGKSKTNSIERCFQTDSVWQG